MDKIKTIRLKGVMFGCSFKASERIIRNPQFIKDVMELNARHSGLDITKLTIEVYEPYGMRDTDTERMLKPIVAQLREEYAPKRL